MFSDLECDYINPIDLCNKLNQVRIDLDCWFEVVVLTLRPIVCRPRRGCARLHHTPVPPLGTMDGAHIQRAPRRVER